MDVQVRGGRGRRLGVALLGVLGTTVLFALFARLEARWLVLGWVAMVPWLAALDRARSAREALGLGALLSVTFTAAVFHWFPGALQAYSRAPTWVGWALFLLVAPVLQLQFPAAALARYVARRAAREGQGWLPPLVGTLAYVGVEGITPKLFADTLGHGLHASEWLRQGADVAGAPGLTLVLLLGNECVLAALRAWRGQGARHALRPVVGLAVLVLGLTGYGASRHAQARAATRAEGGLVVGAVQANITRYEKLKAELGAYQVVRRVLDTHYAMSDALLRDGPVDLLVWPETVYPTPFGTPRSETGAALDAEIAGYVSARGVPLVFGTYDLEGEREFNAAMFLEPSARGDGGLERAAYRKTMLFPLTEWVPDLIDTPTLREWLPWTGRWTRGPGPRAVRIRLRDGRLLRVAPLICYESIFPEYVAEGARQGAELLLTLSNDSWFTGTPAPRLHLMHAAFRSIETRRPQVRVTNSGVSALIDVTGAVVAEVDDGQRAGLTLRVPATAEMTSLALAWGDWLSPWALVAAMAGLAGAVLARR
ncbi:apolipoprotein N-acyltransferase [Myxococcus fulvus]|uniref:Apolipoprotein N-acyltransferase n=1 Tax=Myxococcus fulvus (strain ATCC BAA-855 / HW-1) TaxID=483219 RepID=F8CE61_MYXFH|nr:apolipoprotein N-acyltransferase [Corallococcus macrosporus]